MRLKLIPPQEAPWRADGTEAKLADNFPAVSDHGPPLHAPALARTPHEAVLLAFQALNRFVNGCITHFGSKLICHSTTALLTRTISSPFQSQAQ
jgi:hypothetical protein